MKQTMDTENVKIKYWNNLLSIILTF